jgi:hypothetical protein
VKMAILQPNLAQILRRLMHALLDTYIDGDERLVLTHRAREELPMIAHGWDLWMTTADKEAFAGRRHTIAGCEFFLCPAAGLPAAKQPPRDSLPGASAPFI